jgi:hypothetical protein
MGFIRAQGNFSRQSIFTHIGYLLTVKNCAIPAIFKSLLSAGELIQQSLSSINTISLYDLI